MQTIKYTEHFSQSMTEWIAAMEDSPLLDNLLPHSCTSNALKKTLDYYPHLQVENGWIVTIGSGPMSFVFYQKPKTRRVTYETNK